MKAELAWLREAAGNLHRLAVTVPGWLLEQAAIVGALTPGRGAHPGASAAELVKRGWTR